VVVGWEVSYKTLIHPERNCKKLRFKIKKNSDEKFSDLLLENYEKKTAAGKGTTRTLPNKA